MDAGDADGEAVAVAADAERVLAFAALRAREASTRASGRARAGRGDDGWGSRTDAGDADVELVAVALDAERVVARISLRVREVSTRASGSARADEATTEGDPGWTRETRTLRMLYLPSTTVSLSLSSPPYACAKRRRERLAARADEATTDGDPGWTRETLTRRRLP